MRDIVTSNLPFWNNTRLWVLARPLSGFAETFSQYCQNHPIRHLLQTEKEMLAYDRADELERNEFRFIHIQHW